MTVTHPETRGHDGVVYFGDAKRKGQNCTTGYLHDLGGDL